MHGHAWSDARPMHHRRVAQFTAALEAQDGANMAIREIESLIFMNGYEEQGDGVLSFYYTPRFSIRRNCRNAIVHFTTSVSLHQLHSIPKKHPTRIVILINFQL